MSFLHTFNPNNLTSYTFLISRDRTCLYGTWSPLRVTWFRKGIRPNKTLALSLPLYNLELNTKIQWACANLLLGVYDSMWWRNSCSLDIQGRVVKYTNHLAPSDWFILQHILECHGSHSTWTRCSHEDAGGILTPFISNVPLWHRFHRLFDDKKGFF